MKLLRFHADLLIGTIHATFILSGTIPCMNKSATQVNICGVILSKSAADFLRDAIVSFSFCSVTCLKNIESFITGGHRKEVHGWSFWHSAQVLSKTKKKASMRLAIISLSETKLWST